MTKPRPPREHNYAFATFIALLIAGVVAIFVGLILHREPDYALVLATPQDCLRAFDDKKCHAIVALAASIHASSAPRYSERRICEFDFGVCMPVAMGSSQFFAPEMAVVIIARNAIDDSEAIAPLYFGPSNESAAQRGGGKQVFYHGVAVGILRDKRFGGANISILTDLTGKPLTSDGVRRIRRT